MQKITYKKRNKFYTKRKNSIKKVERNFVVLS